MAAVDPYALCPCGSGQKLKWCCQKIEEYADRARRLFKAGQIAAALEAIEQGLRKDSHNPWLLTLKAVYLIETDQQEAAKAPLRLALEKQPKHITARALLSRLVLQTEGPLAAVSEVQEALAAVEPDKRPALGAVIQLVGSYLGELGYHAASLKHLELVGRLVPDLADPVGTLIRRIDGNPTVSPWLKNRYRLAPSATEWPELVRARFDDALAWADSGLWSAAASAFELLSTEATAGGPAERNVGLCRLWLADHAGAAAALRRSLSRRGTRATDDVVELEALCQHITPVGPDDLVEEVQWTYPLRDRAGLIKILNENPRYVVGEPRPLDPDDEDSPEVETFAILDRPRIDGPVSGPLDPREIPSRVAHVLVGDAVVVLEGYDDGRLDELADQLTAIAGTTIAPAHPKSRTLAKVARSTLALSWQWEVPDGLEPAEISRLNREQRSILLREKWPNTPLAHFGGRTPMKVAQAGGSEVALRASLLVLEGATQARDDIAYLRDLLKVPPEPEIDPATVDLDRLHLARLGLVPVERLDDDRLTTFYARVKRFGLHDALEAANLAILDRPALLARPEIKPWVIYSDQASIAFERGEVESAFDWVRRGRQAEPAATRAERAPVWDMMEIRLKSRVEPPETWVPELAVALDRYRDDRDANQVVILSLIEMGLIRVVESPEKPDEVYLDQSVLSAIVARYGPRVTTASGRLGVAAARGDIWTPGASKAEGGAIWTPGSAGGGPPAAAKGDKPGLILPGR
jgi:tetratricopeptide (TPR) repeat protein